MVWAHLGSQIEATTNRGFTGHEHFIRHIPEPHHFGATWKNIPDVFLSEYSLG